jgi:hypothetical protein
LMLFVSLNVALLFISRWGRRVIRGRRRMRHGAAAYTNSRANWMQLHDAR